MRLRGDGPFAIIARLLEPASRMATSGSGGRVTERRFVNDEETAMPAKKATEKAPAFKTIPAGTAVTWHYRSAIGHGTVTGIHKLGTTADNTMYSINEHDHHPGEPDVVHHSGQALTRAAK